MVGDIPRMVRGLAAVMVIMVAVLMLAPLLVVVGASFNETRFLAFPPSGFTLEWFGKVLANDKYLKAFLVSTQVALAAAFIATALGTLAAWAISKFEFRGRSVFYSFVMSPLLLPSIILAIGLLSVGTSYFGRPSLVLLAAGHIMITMPYVVRSVLGVMMNADPRLEEAARVLGARWWQRYLYVLIPVAAPGMVAGFFLSFIVSFDDAVIALFVRIPGVETLPMAIYSNLEFSADPSVAAVSSLSMLLSAVAVVVVDRTIGLGKAFGVDG